MVFNGLQKLTLLDFPGKTACTVFTAGCDFRCPFCHNASLAVGIEHCEEFSSQEVLAFLKKRSGVLDGVCITGGEPLMHRELPGFMREAKELGYLVKLDTNGSFPDRLKAVIDGRLADYVAMDIKASPQKYAEASGLKSLDISPIFESITLLMNSGIEYEFRTTAFKGVHTPDEMRGLCQMIKGAKRYYIQNFVDSGDLIDKSVSGLSKDEMEALLDEARKTIPQALLRGL